MRVWFTSDERSRLSQEEAELLTQKECSEEQVDLVQRLFGEGRIKGYRIQYRGPSEVD